MKSKLTLIAIALLAIAPLANAAYTISPSGTVSPGNINIEINASGISQATYLAVGVVGSGTLSNFAAGANAPASTSLLGTFGDLGVVGLGQGEIWTIADFSTEPVYPDGIYLTASLLGGLDGDVVTLYETPDGSTYEALGSFTVVPEPMTMGLLGLGGLLIARRRK